MSEQNDTRIRNANLSEQMKTSFLSYAMSVIVARALPDVRDGMKPVHRRILYSMIEQGNTPDKPHKKSARIVGDVMGKYHPHGDSAIYESMVRMAQPFSYRHMLVDGHGNFGSVDGDSAAAMRYTEARLSKVAMEMVRDLNKDTVNFVPNYDGEEREPEVLPSRFPNLLVNGATGIAVGMATNIPTHNLGEVISALHVLMNNPDATTTDLMDVLPGPDFPTGGIVMGKSGIRRAYETGRGRVTVRAKVDIEQTKTGKEQIIVTELPYAVNKARLIERISELARDKRIEGITGIRDESDRDGLRISIDVRRDTSASVILNNLYKETLLQTNFSFNMLAINGGKPQTMSLKDILVAYLTHQREVIRRRTAFDLQKAQARAHILEGLRIALDHIDAIINIIRSSATSEEAKTRLIDGYALSDKQAQAILDMRLVRLTGLERDKIEDEYQKLVALIADLKDILAHQERVDQIIYDELLEIQTKFGDARRTELQVGDVTNLEDEDLIEEEDVIVTLTRNGYIKRVPQAEFKAQNRGGRGVQGMNVNDEDFVDQMLATSTHDTLLFFTNKGKVYRMKGYEVPEYGRQAKGIPVVNLLNFEDDEKIQAVISVRGEASESKDYLFFVTRLGVVKRTAVSEFANIRTNGLKALTLHDGDEVLSVQITNGTQSILIATQAGYSVRFAEDSVRVMGRSAAGVRGIRLRDNDVVIGADVVTSSDNVLVITEKGFGKQTPASEYPIKGRGGKGIKTANITDKNGVLAGMTIIHGHEDIMVTTTQGVMIRFAADSVSQTGRATLGVRLIRLEEGTKVATLTKVDQEDLPDEIATDVTDDTVLNNEQLSQVSELLSRAARDDEDSES
ncbi:MULTISPECIES: DNA gyrase subunit A [Leuconostoc]|jgi:DNA gyrase subunit A|uniref:DNA gyrase subunit A n=2 Tax=Leuconostoc citreum TaxID=33964 RepID=B1MW34_LEUCK|nr:MULTISPECIES: DNA gyrase subunit A [Leuconostoc]ACA81839.1 DNA gyrase, A subunit [Leuconostoc citreum KM20]KAF0260589.1 DNA gyrase subunit A [Leuconostoc citreum]MBA5937753.1 DNA gyrase subunit A [Leuconostoc citreum]MBE4726131.1 DNA gyrase subunit A [Leuconostoc citreum]MBU7451196.1 DNA gyrase subunit A [Leuconostoc citreum]